MVNEESKSLKFNTGLGTTDRVNFHLNQVACFRINGQGTEWANLLFSIFMEVSSKITDEDKKQLNEQRGKIIGELNSMDRQNKAVHGPRLIINSALYNLCWDYELKLREKLDALGILWPTEAEMDHM
jgi:hypothetical protein